MVSFIEFTDNTQVQNKQGSELTGGGGLQISKQLSNHVKGCQNKRNKEKICDVTKTRYQLNKRRGQNKLRGV